VRKRWVPDTVLNIKVISHDEKVLNVSLKILKIFQGRMRRIRVNVHDPKIFVIVKKKKPEECPCD